MVIENERGNLSILKQVTSLARRGVGVESSHFKYAQHVRLAATHRIPAWQNKLGHG